MTYLEHLLGRYLSIRARSEVEIRRYLTQKRKKILVSDELVESLIEKYTRLGYINDVKFAESVSHSLLVNKAKGKQHLLLKLALAGVEREVIQSAIKAIDPEVTKAAMEKRLAKYDRSWGDLEPKMVRQKAYSKLLSAGFSSSEIRPFLDEWLEKRYTAPINLEKDSRKL